MTITELLPVLFKGLLRIALLFTAQPFSGWSVKSNRIVAGNLNSRFSIVYIGSKVWYD